ncbi:amidase family protein, partial [Halomonas sp.]
MLDKTLTQLAAALKSGEFSSRELTSHYLQKIEKADSKINSFITVTAEQALNQAEAADKARAAGNAGLLTGIPLALKDIFCTRDVKTS